MRKARKIKSRNRDAQGNQRKVINPFEEYIIVNGVWFHVWFKEYNFAAAYNVGYAIEDAFFGKMEVVAYSPQWKAWGGPAADKLWVYGPVPYGNRKDAMRYAVKKRQVGKREIEEEKLNA